jgi:hypothetical protein
MRKFVAGVFAALFVIPVLCAGLFLAAARPWILDPAFYKSALANPELYVGWEDQAARGLSEYAAGEGVELERGAAAAGFKAALPAEYLATLGSDAVDRIFARLNAGADGSGLDLRFLKAALDDRLDEFAAAYLAAAGQARPGAAAALEARLEPLLVAIPDSLPAAALPAPSVRGLPAFLAGDSLAALYDRSLIASLAVGILAWLASGMAAHSLWRDRARWLSTVLGFPAAAAIVVGVAAAMGGGDFLARGLSVQLSRLIGFGGPEAVRFAAVFGAALGRIGTGFLVAGLSAGTVSAAFGAARYFPASDDSDPAAPAGGGPDSGADGEGASRF